MRSIANRYPYMSRFWLGCFATCSALSCSAGDPADDRAGAQGGSAPSPVARTDAHYYQTAVHLTPDGPQVSSRVVSTTEQASREKHAPPNEQVFAPSQDSGCAGSSLWIFDQPGGTGNEICFFDDGSQPGTFVNLDNYCVHPNLGGVDAPYSSCPRWDWAGRIRSYYPGSQAGSFTYVDPTGAAQPVVTGIASWGPLTNSPWVAAKNPQYLQLGGSQVLAAYNAALKEYTAVFPDHPSNGGSATAGVVHSLASPDPQHIFAVGLNSGVWESIGGYAWAPLPRSPKYAYALAIDPNNAAHMAVGEYDGDATLLANNVAGGWESFDYGATWGARPSIDPTSQQVQTNQGPQTCNTKAIRSVAFSKTHSTLIAASPCGLIVEPAGQAWHWSGTTLDTGDTTGNVANAVSGVTAVAASQTTLWARSGPFGAGLSYSTNDGATWQTVAWPNGLATAETLYSPFDWYSLAVTDRFAVVTGTDNANILIYVYDSTNQTWRTQTLVSAAWAAGWASGQGGERLIHAYLVNGNWIFAYVNGQEVFEAPASSWNGNGFTWTRVAADAFYNGKTLHSDFHDYLITSDGNMRVVSSDGGIEQCIGNGCTPSSGWSTFNSGLYTASIFDVYGASDAQHVLSYAAMDDSGWFHDDANGWYGADVGDGSFALGDPYAGQNGLAGGGRFSLVSRSSTVSDYYTYGAMPMVSGLAVATGNVADFDFLKRAPSEANVSMTNLSLMALAQLPSDGIAVANQSWAIIQNALFTSAPHNPASPAQIPNNSFEAGSLANWISTGQTSVVSNGAFTGSFAAQVGSASPSGGSSIRQTFVVPAGAVALAFWYKMVCPDSVVYDHADATLVDNNGPPQAILGPTCTNDGLWRQVRVAVTPGHTVTLTLSSTDDGYPSDPTYTLFDEVEFQGPFSLLVANLPAVANGQALTPQRVWHTGGRSNPNNQRFYLLETEGNGTGHLYTITAPTVYNAYPTLNYAWTEITSNIGSPILSAAGGKPSVFVDPYATGPSTSTIYALTQAGVKYSTDGGSTWTLDATLTSMLTVNGRYPITATFGPNLTFGGRVAVGAHGPGPESTLAAMAFSYAHPGARIAASPFGGVYYKNGNAPWKDLSYLLPSPMAPITAVTLVGDTALIGTEGRGLLMITGISNI